MHYHVRVDIRGVSQPEVELDIDEESLQERFVRPFRRRQSLLVNGRAVVSQDLEQIRISRSAEPSREILERIELENADRGAPVFDRLRLNSQVIERAEDITTLILPTPPPTADRRTVLLIRGRWDAAALAMQDFLRAMDLSVQDWATARLGGREGQHNTDILDRAFSEAYAVVVLMTPDDVAALHPDLGGERDERESLVGQPRPNVLFEAGYAWHANRDRTLLVEFGGDLRKLSNLSGVDRVRFDASPAARFEVAERLSSIGAAVKTDGGAHLRAGRFPEPLRPVASGDLDRSPASDFLQGVPLHWVLLATLERSVEIDISMTAEHTGVPPEEVRRALSSLMAKGLAEPKPGRSRRDSEADGAYRITSDGLKRLRTEIRRFQD